MPHTFVNCNPRVHIHLSVVNGCRSDGDNFPGGDEAVEKVFKVIIIHLFFVVLDRKLCLCFTSINQGKQEIACYSQAMTVVT